jgi:hypothetical protein
MKALIGLVLGYVLVIGTADAEECRGSVTEAEAVAAEDSRYAAQMGGNFAALEKLIGDDLVYTHSSAAVDNKKTYIESMRSGAVKYNSMKRSDVTVRTYGCVAILTGRADFVVSNKGQNSNVVLRFHAIWAKRDQGLQFVSWQATRPTQP